MKKSSTVFATFFIIVMCLIMVASPFLTACGPKEKPKVETLTVRDITLDTSEAKTEFAYGEQFTAEGLKVTATLSDGSTRDVPLSSCRISKVNNAPGKRKVSVTYARKTKRYEVVFLDKPMPPISETSLLAIEGEEVYRVQAENIDLEVSGVKEAGGELKLAGGNADGEGYIGNYGVAENYFGFAFTSDKDYDNATAVLRVANPSAENALYFGGEMSVHLNYRGTNDNGSLGITNSVAIPKSEENAPVWCDFALRGLDIKEGTNTLTFSILGEDVPYIDYVDFYIGSEFSNSTVSLADAGEKVVRDFEDLSFEKAVTRDDYMEAYNLSTGEICVLPTAQANGGNAVCALMNGEATTLITAEEDSTVQIIINAASHIDWRFVRDAEIKLDGEVIAFNEHNIRAGSETEVVWKDTSLGFFNLTAGEHLLDIKINSPHAKFDCVTFKTVSKGEFTETRPDVYLDEVGTQIMEGEHLDASDVVVRQDYSELVIGATHGKYSTRTEQTASGGTYIDGFTGFPDAATNPYGNGVEKTKFTVDFYLAKDATVEVNAVACSALGVNFAIRGQVLVNIDGNVCSPAECNLAQYHTGGGNYDEPRWVDTQIARRNLEAGAHTFTFEVLDFFFDLDCIKFKAVSMDGYQPDAVIDSVGTYYIEAEKLDPSGVIARQDFLDAGRISSPTGEYCIEAADNPHGGFNIVGMDAGSYLTARFNLSGRTAVKIYIGAKSNLGIAVWEPSHGTYYVDGVQVIPKVQSVMNANNNSWIELEIADYTVLEAGAHTFKISMDAFAYELDYIKIEVADEPEHSHRWGDWTVTKAPTATEEGKATRVCNGGGACNATVAEKEYTLPVLTSGDYTKTADTATCSAAGSVTYTYNKDGVSVSFNVATAINPEAHDYGVWLADRAEGHYKVCSHNRAHIIGPEAHDAEGARGKCSVCGYNPEHSHAWSDWTVTKVPTATETGKATRTCANANCDATEAEKEYELPVLTSECYKKGADSATCNSAGEMTYSYDKDGVSVSFTVATSAKGHDWSDWAVTDGNKPTATDTGKATRVCANANCDATEAEKEYELPNLASEDYTKSNDTATCSAGGQATYAYEINGEPVNFEAASPVNPEAHDYGDYKQTAGGHFRVCRLNSAHKESVSAHNTDGLNGACAACGFKAIDGVGTYYIEAEKLDPTGVKGRADFIAEGRISSPTDEYCVDAVDNPHGGFNITGMDVGSTLTARFNLTDKAALKIYVGAKSNLGIAVWIPDQGTYYLDDAQLSPKVQSTMNANNNSWIELEIADYTRLEAGAHSFKISMDGFSYELDYIKIEVIGYGETDSEVQTDINLGGAGEYVYEAEWLDDCDVKLQNGQTAAEGKAFPVFTSGNPSNGMFVGGLNSGTWLQLHFDVAEQSTVKISGWIKAGIPVAIWETGHCNFYVDGERVAPPENRTLTETFEERVFFEGILAAGSHVLKIDMNPFGFDMDYFKLTVSDAAV